ncbi:MAG: DNA polymerase III subunit gamma/tau [Paludibacteraceae bacterium]|nr:DNA polymerase III subunit gamma/tau [Paludibacteraceae bacterium]
MENENFIVSARKYRPTTFLSVVGQSSLTNTLKNAIVSNRIAQAYMFCGPRGVGKTTCARIFAKTINCTNLTADNEACNECESCRAFNEHRSYNIHELDAASNNSVEDIRNLIEQVRTPPQIGNYSVYIIDEVHMLSTAAFNAFLKTLEEPLPHAKFILATTEKHKVLTTILSRCQIFDFNRIGINDIVEHLKIVAQKENVTYEDSALNIIAQKADGGMRDALSIFDQVVSFCQGNITYKSTIENLNVLDYEYYFKLVDCFKNCNIADSLMIFNEILNKGFEGQNFINGLSSHFRDLMVSKNAKTVTLLEVGDNIKQTYLEQAQSCSDDFLYKALRISNECDINYRMSKNKRLLVELSLIRLCQLSDEKKKNNIDDEWDDFDVDSLLKIEPFFSPERAKTQQGTSSPSPQTSNVRQSHAQIQTQQNPGTPKVAAMPGVSITNLLTKKEEKQVDSNVPQVQETTQFDQVMLNKAWKEYIDRIPEKKILSSTMQGCTLTIKDNFFIEIAVDNPMQEDELLSERASLTSWLSKSLKNGKIKLYTRVNENGENKKALSPNERFIEMIQNNEHIGTLAKELELEI